MLKPPHLDGASRAESTVSPLSALEISGAVCARVIHDLSSVACGIIGNAEFAESTGPHPENLQKALRAISLSANNAGAILGQCLPLQLLLSAESVPTCADDLAALIIESAPLAPGWRAEAVEPLAGNVNVQPRWLAAAVWQIARESEALRGEIKIACGPAVFPVVWRGAFPKADRLPELFQITLHYRAEQALFTADGPARPERLALLAVHEIVRRFRGQIQARPKPPGRQEISILLPLI
jgi:hypothetical protein